MILRHSNILAPSPRLSVSSSILTAVPDSVVTTTACYRLDCPGIESRWRRNFPHPSWSALVPTQTPILWVFVIPRGKAVGAWC